MFELTIIVGEIYPSDLGNIYVKVINIYIISCVYVRLNFKIVV